MCALNQITLTCTLSMYKIIIIYDIVQYVKNCPYGLMQRKCIKATQPTYLCACILGHVLIDLI